MTPSAARRVLSSRLIAAGIALLGIIATVVAVLIATDEARDRHRADLDADGQAVTRAFEETIEEIEDHLVAIEGLFGASELVTPGEFSRFVEGLGLPEGTIGVGYVIRTTHAPRGLSDVHPGFSRAGDTPVFGWDPVARAATAPLQTADHHDVLVYTAPSGIYDEMIGLDLSSVPSTGEIIDDAVAGEVALATPLFEPITGFQGTEFLVIQPVRSDVGSVEGMAVALADIDRMVVDGLAGRIVDAERIEVHDVTGTMISPVGDWMTVLSGFGRQWEIRLAPVSRFSAVSMRRLAAVLSGFVVSLGAGALVASIVANRRSRREIARLDAAQQQTDRLLCEVSHELRTPLTTIVGFIDEMRNRWDQLPEADRLEMLAFAEKGALDIESLVEDLLVRERMISGTPVPIATDPVDIAAEIGAAIDGLGVEARLSTHGTTAIRGDARRVRQVTRNLLVAAEIHGSGHIDVGIGTRAGEGIVTVAFGSPGIPACCRSGLFDLHPAPHRHDGSVPSMRHGFALPVARHLATEMGGDLVYEPMHRRFVVRLPLAAERALVA